MVDAFGAAFCLLERSTRKNGRLPFMGPSSTSITKATSSQTFWLLDWQLQHRLCSMNHNRYQTRKAVERLGTTVSQPASNEVKQIQGKAS